MEIRRIAGWIVGLMLAIVILSLLASVVLGHPVLLGFVETGSMDPAMGTGDGFVAVPHAIAGDVGIGDVIVYENSQGDLTTHRVVGETPRGYLTQGDANLVTDQDGGEPPVQAPQIKAVALASGADPVVIPHLGTAVTGINGAVASLQGWVASTLGLSVFVGPEGLLLLVFLLAMAALAVDVYLARGRRDRPRRTRSREDGTSVRSVLLVCAAIVMLSATAAMIVPADTHEFGVISADFGSDRPDIVERGTTDDFSMPVNNDRGFLPVHVYAEAGSDGVTVHDEYAHVPGGATREIDFSIDAPQETGFYPMFVQEHRYLGVLPGSVIGALHRIHPWVALGAINLLLGGLVYGVGRAVVGTPNTRLRRRPSRAGRSTVERLRRYLTLT